MIYLGQYLYDIDRDIAYMFTHVVCVHMGTPNIHSEHIHAWKRDVMFNFSGWIFLNQQVYIFGMPGHTPKKQSDKPAVYENKKPKNKCSHICPANRL